MEQNLTDNIIDDLRFLTQPKPLWFYLVIIGVCISVYLIVKCFKKRKDKKAIPVAVSESQTVEDALDELEKLRAKMNRENSRLYAIKASGIIRRYIERRFGIHAPLRSTEEFLVEAQMSNSLSDSDKQSLGNFLVCCDFLKFARAFAEREELEKLHESAVEFVKRTNHQPLAVQSKTDGRLNNAITTSADKKGTGFSDLL